MVRLKDYSDLPAEARFAHFNSSMVRLKELSLLLLLQQLRFQFQYGTIKSRTGSPQPLIRTGFQFQYGTIKRIGSALTQVYKADFNSSMVRLKGHPQSLLSEIIWNFNSSMVRLKG